MKDLVTNANYTLAINGNTCNLSARGKEHVFGAGNFEGFLASAAWIGLKTDSDTFKALVIDAVRVGAIEIESYLRWANGAEKL